MRYAGVLEALGARLAATYESLTFMEAHESKHLLEDILSALASTKSAKKSS